MPKLFAALAALGLNAACSPTFETAAPPPTVVAPPGSVVVPAR